MVGQKVFTCKPDIKQKCWCMEEDFVQIDKEIKDCVCKDCLSRFRLIEN